MRNVYRTLTIGFIFLTLKSFAQTIDWRTSPATGFVFQINNAEAEKLLARSKPDTIFKGMLHTQIDTFNVRRGWIDRPDKGHFILARIVENSLVCEYTSVFPYQVFLLKEYDALALQVLDSAGNVREDARVKLKKRRLRIDPKSKTYRMENAWFGAGNSIVTVELEGFRSVFNVVKHDVPSWEPNYYNNYDDGPDFYSYLITDKNKYKPIERVRFKSYALSNSRTPLRKKLEAWVIGMNKYVRVAEIEPHRPGSFAGEFVLHDSLKLLLDKYYTLELRERNGRVVASTTFKYEEYELHRNQLKVELRSQQQFHPASNEIVIDATDVNGLRLKDAKATIIIRTESIREIFERVVSLPDTLLYKTVDLNSVESTVVEIPSSLFQKSNTVYQVDVAVTNSENHRMEQRATGFNYYSQYEITTRFSNDSIIYELRNNGVVMQNVPMTMHRNSDVSGKQVILPFKEKINPALLSVRLSSDQVSRTIVFRDLLPKLDLKGGIEKDSFKVSMDNPQKLQVSWFVYQGSQLLEKGFGDKFDHRSLIVDRTQTYYAELLFSFGGEEKIRHGQYVFQESFLDVSMDIPDRVYPGQSIEALVKVTNDAGDPVSGVDLTAWATTAKLSYYVPDLPYYGGFSSPRPERANYSKSTINKRNATLPLDYKKWTKIARLDTMKYYQFTYPYNNAFVHTVTCQDSTQFAPYVMHNGVAKQIHVIEVDRKPVYYSWTKQPKGFSFYVTPGRRVAVTLRLQDRVLIMDSLVFERGKKTIISIDLDHLPKKVLISTFSPQTLVHSRKRKSIYWRFTQTEVSRHTQYVAAFRTTDRTAYLYSYNAFTPLFHKWHRNSPRIIAGPISPDFQTYEDDGYQKTHYRHAGGFTYEFEDNIVYKLAATDLIPERLDNLSINPMPTVNDFVITKARFLQRYEDEREKWHPSTIDLLDHATHLRLLLPEEKEKTGVVSVVFQNVKTGEILSPCRYSSYRSDFFTIPRGLFHTIVLYNSGAYLKMDNIEFRSHRKIVADMKLVKQQSADSTSLAWLRTANTCFKPVSTLPSRSYSINYFDKKTGNVRGVIQDDINQPLPGVNIVEKNTVNGTVSDASGEFSLDITSNYATLVISFIGLQTKEIDVRPGSQVVVTMEPDVTQLSEVVVVGYGTQEKRHLSASVSTVLMGKVAGIAIKPGGEDDNDGSPASKEDEDADAVVREAENRLYQELLSLKTIRSNFSDVGFWEPKLFTDRRGQSKFTITFPDDITRWDATVYAMNRQLKTGTFRKSIRSYKPLMAELHVPNFLTVGDSANFTGKILNYTGDENIKGKVKWEGADSRFEKDVSFADYHSESLPLYASVEADSLSASYTFTRDDGYLDGEKRSIPVNPQGVIRADGALSVLKNHEEVSLKAGKTENVHIKIFDNQLEFYSGEVAYLLNYKYACNEQLASKLIGLVQHKLLMKYEGKTFKYDKDVNKIIQRLLRNQNQEFLWSWWDVSPATSYWMSAHILRALKMAKDAGYPVQLDLDNLARKVTYKFEGLKDFSPYDADLLHALATWNVDINYTRYIHRIDSLVHRTEASYRFWWNRYSLLKEKFLLMETRQLRNLPFERDSLLHYKNENILGEVHFADNKPSYGWYSDEMAANTIAYRIVSRDSVLRNLTTPMQMYFLSQRRRGGWNTYQASNILMSILPDLLAAGFSKGKVARVTLRGKVNTTLEKFPFTTTLTAGEELHLRKESGLPLYYMQYKEERVTKAKTGGKGFRISTNFSEETLTAGKPVVLRVEVDVEKDASFEHVMIDVPIPASCSYADKRQRDNYIETHREHFKDRTAIFCENMKAGKHVFQIHLLPRFTGKYIVNPAEVMLMYIPVVNANTELKRVSVE